MDNKEKKPKNMNQAQKLSYYNDLRELAEAFRLAGAISPETAKTPTEAGAWLPVEGAISQEKAVVQGWLVPVDQNRFYVDPETVTTPPAPPVSTALVVTGEGVAAHPPTAEHKKSNLKNLLIAGIILAVLFSVFAGVTTMRRRMNSMMNNTGWGYHGGGYQNGNYPGGGYQGGNQGGGCTCGQNGSTTNYYYTEPAQVYGNPAASQGQMMPNQGR